MPGFVKFTGSFLIFLTAALAVWFFVEERQSVPVSSKVATLGPPGSSVTATPAVIPEIELRFEPRARQRYTYKFERRIGVEGFGNKSPETGYHGEFFLDVVRSDAQGFTALVSEQVQELKAKKSVQLRVHVDTRGENLQIFSEHLHNDDEREHANVLRDLLANFIFPLTTDTVGKFQARFENLPDADGLVRRKKTKITYSSGQKPLPEIVRSEHILSWDTALGFPRRVDGREATQIGQGQMNLSSRNVYAITFVRTTPIANLSKHLAKWNTPESLALSRTKLSLKDHPEYAHLNWPALARQLEDLNKMSASEQLKVFGDLVKLLRMNGGVLPDVLAMLSADIIRQGAMSPLFKLVVGTLATVASPAAQSALRDIYQNPECPISGKGTILAALTTTQASLNENTRNFLTRTLQNESNGDLANGAAFALGSSLQNAPNDASSANAVKILERAWAGQSQRKNIGEQLVILDAMGNSGRLEFLPILQKEIYSNDEAILRARAVFSLRYIQADSATSMLGKNLANTDPLIREAAVKAMQLATWTENFRAPLNQCVAAEPLPHIQGICQLVLQQASQVAGN